RHLVVPGWGAATLAERSRAADVDHPGTGGLPVIPPTEAAVAEFLEVAGLDPDQVVLNIPRRHRRVTVRLAAINAVMAGCLPGYFPIAPRRRGKAGPAGRRSRPARPWWSDAAAPGGTCPAWSSGR